MAERNFNPFTSQPASTTNPVIDAAVSEFAKYFLKTSDQLLDSDSDLSKSLKSQKTLEYISEKIDELLDKEANTDEECFQIAALFFLLGSTESE